MKEIRNSGFYCTNLILCAIEAVFLLIDLKLKVANTEKENNLLTFATNSIKVI